VQRARGLNIMPWTVNTEP